MKKIQGIIFMFCFMVGTVFAQEPVHRTVSTILADMLALMPSPDEQQQQTRMKTLLSTGEEGILQLVNMLNPSDKESRPKIEYALSGLCAFASVKGNELERLIVVKAFLKGLESVQNNEVKSFLIRELSLIGKDEIVDKMATYLTDPILSDPAIEALIATGTPAAGQVLLQALQETPTPVLQAKYAHAIGALGYANAEPYLLQLLPRSEISTRAALLHTLGLVGTENSLSALSSASEKVGFSNDPSGATDSYILLINRILDKGNTLQACMAAEKLRANAEKAGQGHVQIAALQITMHACPEKRDNLLKMALKSPSRDYRNAAILFATEIATNNSSGNEIESTNHLLEILLKELNKGNDEIKIDILQGMSKIYHIKMSEELDKEAARDAAKKLLSEKDTGVRNASANLLIQLGDKESTDILAKLLCSKNIENIKLGQSSLQHIRGNIAPSIIACMSSAKSAGKVAILELLAARKADRYASVVFGELDAKAPDTRATAYSVLKDVVTEKDLPVLYDLLTRSSAETIEPLQAAIVSALERQSPETRFSTLATQVNKSKGEQQPLYYNVLAATGSLKALDYLILCFDKSSGWQKTSAFNALLQWNGQEVADKLLSICQNSSLSEYFDRALSRYTELASSPKLTGENRRLMLQNALNLAKTDIQIEHILREIGNTGSFTGMMLAGNYLDRVAVQQTAAWAVMNIAINNKEYTGNKVRALLEKAATVLNNPDATYQQEAIKKHLTEMPVEEGFVSIFNGKDLTGWKGLVENPLVRATMKPDELSRAQLKADEQMEKDWKVVNGLLSFTGSGFNNLCTEKKYGDFEMFIDWKLDPSGHDADAGIYLRGTPQVQIWDTSRRNVGAQVGSGGLYNNQQHPSKPICVADNKLGDWNSMYIKMIGDRVTVKLNGILVVDNVILENYWDRKIPIPVIEQIELQAHGSPVYYRDIYIKELQRFEPYTLSTQEKKEGYKILFDGTNMHEWTGNMVDYQLEDGCISVRPTSSWGGNLYTRNEYADFIFRFEFQLTAAANNGVGIRAPMEGDNAYNAMEIQILDCEHPVYKDLMPYQHHGSIYGVIAAQHGAMNPVGEWNTEEIYAKGNHIKVTLNGQVILDGDIKTATKKGTLDHQNHPGLFNKKGHIGFLGHGSELKFRNIRIKVLK
ncbi:MAG: DUF1080 domain-containing protein [Bacteroidales bacterium]|jgi:HEAT repeat protein|nr:DUF1080 domain-containing protein [Bacteroidales bacterium]